jgi:hypothetical protein
MQDLLASKQGELSKVVVWVDEMMKFSGLMKFSGSQS